VLSSGQHVEHRGDVAGELLAVGGQGDLPVWSGAIGSCGEVLPNLRKNGAEADGDGAAAA
jgi:hypothetical protein